MKKTNNKTNKQTPYSPVTIIASLEEPFMVKELVERLADRRYDIGYSCEAVPDGWEAIETSSIEAYVSVNLDLSAANDRINTSFTTSFIFTCAKSMEGSYDLSWFNSLS